MPIESTFDGEAQFEVCPFGIEVAPPPADKIPGLADFAVDTEDSERSRLDVDAAKKIVDDIMKVMGRYFSDDHR
eukprot:708497-Pleurochrysis_carterae.AAC.1